MAARKPYDAERRAVAEVESGLDSLEKKPVDHENLKSAVPSKI